MSPLARAVALLAGLLAVRVVWPPGQPAWLPVPLLAAALIAVSLLLAWRRRGSPANGALAEDPGLFVLVAALAVLLLVLASHRMRIVSDGLDHYVYLRSVWIDHDLDLANDFAALSPRGQPPAPSLTPLGRAGNAHPVGPALVWSPFFLLADAASRLTGRAPDGENELYRNAVAVASTLYGWLGLLLVYAAARPRAGRGPALLAVLGIGFGSFLYWYLAFAPTMAHAPAFGAAALVLWLWLRPTPGGDRRALALGAACGLAALLKWANGLLILLPLVEALPRFTRRREWPALARETSLLALAALVAFTPQMVAWKLLYGSYLTIPLGTGFVANAPAFDGVLFSPRHGLLSWSPLLYVGLAGLLPFARREPWKGVACMVFGLGLLRVNAGVADWWGGAAFGARRFDALLPMLDLGMALAFARLAALAARRPLLLPAGVLAGFVAWNLLLARQYGSGAWDYSEPVSFEEMGHAAVSAVDRAVGSPFSLPGALLGWALGGPRPADYESGYAERLHSRWSIRMGVDDRLYLEDGWSAPLARDGAEERLIVGASAGLVVPLHRAQPYRLGLRLRGPEGARLRVLVNQRPLAEWGLGPELADYEAPCPAELLRPGRNFVRLRVLGEPDQRPAAAGAWMEPAAPR